MSHQPRSDHLLDPPSVDRPCPTCREPVPRAVRYCPECGRFVRTDHRRTKTALVIAAIGSALLEIVAQVFFEGAFLLFGFAGAALFVLIAWWIHHADKQSG